VSARTALLLAMSLTLGAGTLHTQNVTTTAPAPPDSVIAAGQALYHGAARCNPCHGDNGGGTLDGPSLVSGAWKLGDGDLPWLLHITRHAGWGTSARDGEPRPMRGPGTLDSAQVEKVAAYVWSISRGKQPRQQ